MSNFSFEDRTVQYLKVLSVEVKRVAEGKQNAGDAYLIVNCGHPKYNFGTCKRALYANHKGSSDVFDLVLGRYGLLDFNRVAGVTDAQQLASLVGKKFLTPTDGKDFLFTGYQATVSLPGIYYDPSRGDVDITSVKIAVIGARAIVSETGAVIHPAEGEDPMQIVRSIIRSYDWKERETTSVQATAEEE